jgi:hypothetical protein
MQTGRRVVERENSFRGGHARGSEVLRSHPGADDIKPHIAWQGVPLDGARLKLMEPIA